MASTVTDAGAGRDWRVAKKSGRTNSAKRTTTHTPTMEIVSRDLGVCIITKRSRVEAIKIKWNRFWSRYGYNKSISFIHNQGTKKNK
jgi:hypothetical protein